MTTYFKYHEQGNRCIFVGTDKKQILSTFAHYREQNTELQMPDERKIHEMRDLEIPYHHLFLKPHQTIDVTIDNTVRFQVNANAFLEIQAAANEYETMRRGDLYLLAPLTRNQHVHYLPRNVMEGLRAYDWHQHDEQIISWLDIRGDVLAELESAGLIMRKRS